MVARRGRWDRLSPRFRRRAAPSSLTCCGSASAWPSSRPDQALLQFRGGLQEVFGDRRISELSTLLGRFLGFEAPESPLGSALAGRPEQGAELARAVLGRCWSRTPACARW